MRWDRLRVVEVSLPFQTPFHMATALLEHRRTVLVGVERDGVTGWGEAAPWYGVTPENTDDVWAALTSYQPGDEQALPGTAMAALDEADLDQQARAVDSPLGVLIGGSLKALPCSPAIGIKGSIGALEAEVAAAVRLGYPGVKLKIQPGWDHEPVSAIVGLFPKLEVGVDANGSYGDSNDPIFPMLDKLGLVYIEQPLPAFDLGGLSELRSQITTPVCLDESVLSVVAAQRVIAAQAADILCLKPGRVGVRGALMIHELAVAAGIALKATGLLESSIGRGHTMAVASLSGVTHLDLAATRWYFRKDVTTAPWEADDGHIAVPNLPGIGTNVDEEQLAALAGRSVTRDNL